MEAVYTEWQIGGLADYVIRFSIFDYKFGRHFPGSFPLLARFASNCNAPSVPAAT